MLTKMLDILSTVDNNIHTLSYRIRTLEEHKAEKKNLLQTLEKVGGSTAAGKFPVSDLKENLAGVSEPTTWCPFPDSDSVERYLASLSKESMVLAEAHSWPDAENVAAAKKWRFHFQGPAGD